MASGYAAGRVGELWKQWLGQVVHGTYPLLELVGSSEESAVFRTSFRDSKRKAAIKLTTAEGADVPLQISRWNEATTLSHPHLLPLFASGECRLGGRPFVFVVMEFADENLSQILPHRPLTPTECREMLAPTLEALDYLHSRGLVHGQLRPSNIFAVDDKIKLSTDSLCGVGAAASLKHAPGTYSAPETALRLMSPAADVWSIGLLIIEALTQRLPFHQAEKGGGPVIPAALPAPFAEIARNCLRLDPERRWKLGDISAALQERPSKGPSLVKTSAAPTKDAAQLTATTTVKPAVNQPPLTPAVAAPSVASSRAAEAKSPSSLLRYGVALIALLIVVGIFVLPKLGKNSPAQDSQPVAGTTSSDQPASSPSNPPASLAGAPANSNEANSAGKRSASTANSSTSATHESAATAPPTVNRTTPEAETFSGAITHRVIPDVPRSSRNTITGHVKVRVRVSVDPSGSVSHAQFDSMGPSKYFARLAMESAQEWKFRAPQQNGVPVPSEWTLLYEFGRSGTEVIPTQVRR